MLLFTALDRNFHLRLAEKFLNRGTARVLLKLLCLRLGGNRVRLEPGKGTKAAGSAVYDSGSRLIHY
jgi:hypothetical protein